MAVTVRTRSGDTFRYQGGTTIRVVDGVLCVGAGFNTPDVAVYAAGTWSDAEIEDRKPVAGG